MIGLVLAHRHIAKATDMHRWLCIAVSAYKYEYTKTADATQNAPIGGHIREECTDSLHQHLFDVSLCSLWQRLLSVLLAYAFCPVPPMNAARLHVLIHSSDRDNHLSMRDARTTSPISKLLLSSS